MADEETTGQKNSGDQSQAQDTGQKKPNPAPVNLSPPEPGTQAPHVESPPE